MLDVCPKHWTVALRWNSAQTSAGDRIDHSGEKPKKNRKEEGTIKKNDFSNCIWTVKKVLNPTEP